MRKLSNTKLIFSFTALTVILTWAVILTYGHFLRQPFYAWVESLWPDKRPLQDQIEQFVEHFFISTMVDVVVVTLLLRLVNRQQRKLHDSEARYRALFEHASDGIGVVTTVEHVLVDVNRKFNELFGYDPQPLIGSHVCDLFERLDRSPADSRLSARAFHDLMAKLEHEQQSRSPLDEISIQTASGAPLILSLSHSTISTGKERLLMLIFRDQTEHVLFEREKQEMQRQLYQSSKLASIGELSAGVAHEINNPLNAMINFAQLLKDDGVARTESERQMLEGIIAEGSRIARIVRDLLTFARQSPHAPTRVDLGPVIENAVSLFAHQLEKEGIDVELDIPETILPMRADASRLRQVIINMISNAYHALGSKDSTTKRFRISARNAERAGKRTIRLDFYDNGVGISRQVIDKIFDPFFTSRRDCGGTGLGLSLSFGIVHGYGGKITVESEEGRFTRFTVELPAEDEQGEEYGENFVSGRRAEHPLDDGGIAQA